MKSGFYKSKYFIAFYSLDGEELLYTFDNVREICQFQGKKPTRANINLINVEIYRGLKRKTRLVKFLTGEPMKIYIYDTEENE